MSAVLVSLVSKTISTLGARGFSCAVSGFGQVLKSDPAPLVSSAFGRRCVGLRPTKLLVTRKKKPLVPRVDYTLAPEIYSRNT